MKSMSWQAFITGAKGMFFYSIGMLYSMDHVTPFEERWDDFISLTEEIWKYKDIILSIVEVNKIEYKHNPNVVFRQWKYNESNYIVIANLERKIEIFEINLLGEYNLYKEFGLGKYQRKGKQIIFELELIDVIMIKYILSTNKSKNSYIAIPIAIIIIIISIALGLTFVKKYLKKKNEIENFLIKTNKLIN